MVKEYPFYSLYDGTLEGMAWLDSSHFVKYVNHCLKQQQLP